MGKLLLVSPTPTHPPCAGNRVRINHLLEQYEDAGVDFHFLYIRQEDADEAAMATRWGKGRCTFLDHSIPPRRFTYVQRLRAKLTRLATGRKVHVPYRIDDWCDQALLDRVKAVVDRIQPDCVQVEYVFLSRLFDCCPQRTFKILDTHDIFADRHKMFLAQGKDPEWFYTTPSEERSGARRADCILAIQAEERAYFESLTGKPVITIGHSVALLPPAPPLAESPTAMFVGSENGINRDAMDFLVKDVWPKVLVQVPNATLEVYGTVCHHVKAAIPGVRLMGKVDDLAIGYARAWVVLCPLRLGTGLKIKSVEALGCGKALVSTSAGSAGLGDLSASGVLRGDTADEFSQHCVSVLADGAIRSKLESFANDFTARWNESNRKAFKDLLKLAGLK